MTLSSLLGSVRQNSILLKILWKMTSLLIVFFLIVALFLYIIIISPYFGIVLSVSKYSRLSGT